LDSEYEEWCFISATSSTTMKKSTSEPQIMTVVFWEPKNMACSFAKGLSWHIKEENNNQVDNRIIGCWMSGWDSLVTILSEIHHPN
jgi:hypothetical protein